MTYNLFDPAADVDISSGHLPHWEQAGCYYFITFHTADSLPQSAREACREDRDRWLLGHGIDPAGPDWRARLAALAPAERRRFAARFTSVWQRHLDRGHGQCRLREPRLRSVVVETLQWFDGQRYGIEAFVVMPNHVHVLVGLPERGLLARQCRSWKQFSATRINALLRRRGAFWQTESWDRLVRSPESFERIRRYIVANPRTAGLEPWEYTLYVKPDGVTPRSPVPPEPV